MQFSVKLFYFCCVFLSLDSYSVDVASLPSNAVIVNGNVIEVFDGVVEAVNAATVKVYCSYSPSVVYAAIVAGHHSDRLPLL